MAEILEHIYSLTNKQNACWKDVCCYEYLQNLRLFDEEISTECDFTTREQLLLKLSTIQKLFRHSNGFSCAKKLEFCNYLLSDFNLLENLTMCHDFSDQVLVFSASKALSNVLAFLPVTSKNKVWFCAFLDFQTVDTKTSPWRVLYTLSMVTNLLHSYQSNKNCEEAAPDCMCVCQGSQDMFSCSSVKEMTVFMVCHVLNKLENLTLNCLPIWQEFRNIEIICDIDSVAEASREGVSENGPFKDFCMEVHKRKIGFCHFQSEFEDRYFALLLLFYEALKCVAAILCRKDMSEVYSSDIRSFTTTKLREGVKIQLGKDTSKCLLMDMNKNPNGLNEALQFSEMLQESSYSDTDIRSSIIEFSKAKIFPLLVHCLHIKHFSQILVKKILDVIDQLLSFPENNSFTTKNSITYLENCAADTARSFISVFNCCVWESMPRCQGFIGFGGNNLLVSSVETDSGKSQDYFDDNALRKMSLILLKSLVLLDNYETRNVQTDTVQKGRRMAETLFTWAANLKTSPFRANRSQLSHDHLKVHDDGKASQNLELRDVLCDLFSEQDDELVEVLLLLLQLYCKLQERTRSYIGTRNLNTEDRIQTVCCDINPHTLFLSFLQTVCFDQSVILDFLVSSETTFLSYLVSYLHCILNNWAAFVSSHKGRIVDDYDEAANIDNSEEKGKKDSFENLQNSSSVTMECEYQSKLAMLFDSSFTDAKNEMLLTKNLVENNSSFSNPCSTNSGNDSYNAAENGYDGSDLIICSDDDDVVDDDVDDDVVDDDDVVGDDDVVDDDVDDDDDVVDDDDVHDDVDDVDDDVVDDDGDGNDNETIHNMDHDGGMGKACNDNKVNVDSKISWHENINLSGIDKVEVVDSDEYGSSEVENEMIHSACCSSGIDKVVVEDSDKDGSSEVENEMIHSACCSKEIDCICCSNGTVTDNPKFSKNSSTYSGKLQPAEESEAVPVSLEKTMSVLIRLRLSIERLRAAGLFPFWPEPLLRLMHRVESIYDGC